MGICATPTEIGRSSELISSRLVEESQKDKFKVKLLLLGTGNTGKSTFFRQFKIHYGNGISTLEREIFRDQILDQSVYYMGRLTQMCLKKHNEEEEAFALEDEILQLITANWCYYPEDQPAMDQVVGEQIRRLWADPQIREVYYGDVVRHELLIPASCEYHWNDITRVSDPSFSPTDQDCVAAYNRTSGIADLQYSFKGGDFQIVDIGGQRSERRKWIHVFDEVKFLLYVVSLSAYDEVLFEDGKTNSMTEQLGVFEDAVNSAAFADIPVIVFLNKSDLLQNKIDNGRPISAYFEDYSGDGSFKSSVKFIKKTFKNLNKMDNRRMFFHTTCATSTEDAKRVLGDVTTLVVGDSLAQGGLM